MVEAILDGEMDRHPEDPEKQRQASDKEAWALLVRSYAKDGVLRRVLQVRLARAGQPRDGVNQCRAVRGHNIHACCICFVFHRMTGLTHNKTHKYSVFHINLRV